MIIRQESGDRWLPVRIGDFEKGRQACPKSRRGGWALSWLPAAEFTAGALSDRRLRSAANARGCG
jgi:hypothetical protein